MKLGTGVKKTRKELSMMDQFQSRIVINIELPSPVKRFYKFYLFAIKILTGDDKGTWEDFVRGDKVSDVAIQLKFMFAVLLYTSTIVIALTKPHLLPLFWIVSYAFLHFCRYIIFSHSEPRGTFFLIDYCYYAAFLTMLLFIVPGLNKNPDFYATVFTLQTGMALNSVVGMPGVNSLTFGSKASISHLQLVYLHYVPSLTLLVDLFRKRSEEPWTYDAITSRYEDTKTVAMRHIVFPVIAYLLWAAVYLSLTEIIYYAKIYRSSPPYYTQTNYNLGYFRPKRFKGLQKLMEKFLKRFYLLRSEARFKPERKYGHHVTAIALYNVGVFLLMLCLLPVSVLFMKNINVLALWLGILFLVIVYNGSEKMLKESKTIRKSPTLALKTRKQSETLSEATTDTEDLVEGDDEHWTKVYEDKTVLKKSKLREPEESTLPKPVPLNSGKKAVDKDI